MRIDPRNNELMALPDDHPAKRFLLEHKRFCEECIGCEIPWKQGPPPIEQEFWSESRKKMWTLSGILYAYFSLHPVLGGWMENPPKRTDSEKYRLSRIDEARRLLYECKEQALADENELAIPIIERAFDLLDCWEYCIVSRTSS